MSNFPKVILRSGRDRSLKRFHLWVFSGAVKNIEGRPADGDMVEVYSASDEYLATGHYQNGSIMVRIFSFEKTNADFDFWKEKIAKTILFRQKTGFFDNPETNVFRLIHGEGDGFPGLIIDFYNGVVVLQAHSVGMFKIRQTIADALMEILLEKVKAVYDKSESTLNIAQNTGKEKFLTGTSANVEVSEYGNRFEIDFREGQKTGFFIDQRENRKLLQKYCSGKKVANIFCYTGGFSVYAARGGATLVDSVDSSEKAMDLARKNMVTNFGESLNHRFFTTDAFDFLKNQQEKYEVIILDPPAFAKHQAALENALKAYRGINETAIKNIAPGGILFTFSCSQVVNKDDFRVAVFSGAAATGRNVRILHQLSQPADHPINIYHPEGEYLKGLVLFVE